MRAPLRIAVVLLGCLWLGGCGVGYYAQAVGGHLELMRAQRDIVEVIEDPATPPELAERLQTALAIREFAVTELGLPDNSSYTRFVQLDRDAVVWNVVAVPEFSLTPHQWCVPVAGCLAYRGYFSRERAEALATQFAARGHDTLVGGVTAYSTLGRLRDPLLSTMLRGDEHALAAVMIHELAHQRLYIPDDTAFNEAFATAVEQHGTRLWLKARGDADGLLAFEQLIRRREVLDELIGAQRERLSAIYASGLDEAAMRTAKAQAFQTMRTEYAERRAQWDGGVTFDGWFGRPLNNADLVAVATYRHWVPAFERMIDQASDLERFYERAGQVGAMDAEARAAYLQALLESVPPD